MKKNTSANKSKQLTVKTQTVRELQSNVLASVGGGMTHNPYTCTLSGTSGSGG